MNSKKLVAILQNLCWNLDRDELVRRTDLEEETIDDVIRILKSEFE
jgi:hypothetical protein